MNLGFIYKFAVVVKLLGVKCWCNNCQEKHSFTKAPLKEHLSCKGHNVMYNKVAKTVFIAN